MIRQSHEGAQRRTRENHPGIPPQETSLRGLSRLCSQFVTQRSLDGIIGVLDAMQDEEIGPEWLLRSLNNGWSPLNHACWNGFAEAAILMLDRGVSKIPR